MAGRFLQPAKLRRKLWSLLLLQRSQVSIPADTSLSRLFGILAKAGVCFHSSKTFMCALGLVCPLAQLPIQAISNSTSDYQPLTPPR